MNISFSEIVDISKIQELHDSIYETFGLLTAILDPDGTILVSSGWKTICTEFHRKHPESAARCRESDIALAKPLGKNEKYKSYKCLNGLIDVAMPIHIEGEHIATLFTGQFFFENPDINFFRDQARQFGYDEKKYLDALQDVPVFTRNEIDRHMSYLAKQAMLFIELGLKEKRYRLLVENQNNLIVTFDQNLCLQYVSPNYCKIFGAKEKDILGKPFFPLIHGDDVEVVRDSIATLKNPPYSTYHEERAKTVNGWRWFGWSLKASFDNEGNILETIGVGRDITEQKEAQEALKKSEGKYRELMENANSIILRWIPDGTITFFNEFAQKFFGFEASEIIGKKAIGSIVPETESTGRDLKQMVSGILKNPAKYEQNENENICKDGKRVWVNWTNRAIQDQNGSIIEVLSIGTDITERKRAVEALTESENLLKLTGDMANIGAWQLDLDSRKIIWTQTTAKIHEVPNDYVPNLNEAINFYHPDDREVVKKSVNRAIETGKSYDFEARLITAKGKQRWVSAFGKPTFEAGKCKKLYGTFQDITERKRSEQELVRLSTAIEQVRDTIIIFGMDGIVQYVNPALEKQVQYNRYELIGKDFANLSKGILNKKKYKKVWETINKGASWSGNIIGTSKDGSQFAVNINISPVFDDTGMITCFTSIGRDITKEQQMEEQLRQSQKMEAMGTLAGGIAHDFNNILAGILGYTELAQDDADQNSPVQEYLVEILKSTTRARDLVKQILTFSRKSHEERKPVLLHPVIQEAAKLLRSTIPTTIEINQNIDDTTGMVNADPTQMHQIVMNLCTNAFHAMQETGGVLEIELSSVVISQESMRKYNNISPGPFLELKISDTGTGIDSKIIYRIFEPFFTTKDKEKGTGMGLAVVYGIVKDHGGDISIDSQVGKGTTFRVMLPQVIAEPDNKEDSSSKVPTGTEHILFVDDEKTLMDLWKRILESLGYTVTAKNSSLEALETFQKSPDIFDMVITDQTMPHMTGYNLAKRILEIKPSANIILCTGYSDTVSPEKTEAAGIKALVYKPISKKEIAQKIRGVLDKHNL